jgi:hypothetical protein
MSAPSALQSAIHARLSADTAVKALLGDPPRLYDRTPPDVIFPYAVHARIETRVTDVSEVSTSEHAVTLHVWSRHGGAKEAQAVMEALRASLHHAPLTLAGHRLVLLIATFQDVFRAQDLRTFVGVLRLKAVTEAL